MCGIVGYIGKGMSRAHVLEGLARLEYRGYDAGGFGCISSIDQRLYLLKALGNVENLVALVNESRLDGHAGIGHTRWSTHGAASDVINAHPHTDCTGKISVIHNGIIENHRQLKQELVGTGHVFKSQTDTEIIAHLLEELLAASPKTAYRDVFFTFTQKLEGAYALACLIQDMGDTIILVRKRSPLCIGIGSGEMFAASDPLAFADKADSVIFMPDESIAFLGKDSVELYDFYGHAIEPKIEKYVMPLNSGEKGPYEHFMLKEIYEQKKVIYDTLFALKKELLADSGDKSHAEEISSTSVHSNATESNLDKSIAPGTDINAAASPTQSKFEKHIGLTDAQIRAIEHINFLGCGTSWHAGRIAQFFFEQIAGIKAQVHLASEFRYMPFIPEKNGLFIAISQSGETADTLEALRMIRKHAIHTIALTNVQSSSMMREANGYMLTHAGPEIAVASTKAFTAQLTALFWLAHFFALKKKMISQQEFETAEKDLLVAAEILENALEINKKQIVSIDVPFYTQFKHFIFLGRHISYPLELEAALKLKEISYLFADACPAGELKHGLLALVDAQTPVFLFSCLDDIIYQKLVSNAQEIKSRHGHLIVFAFENQHELIQLADLAYIFPSVNPLLAPLAMTGLIQFFCYHMAKALGRPIDKPRNLAKSVTVE